MQFDVGDFVGVPVQYAVGAFDDELMVSLQRNEETISGFVRRENVSVVDGSNALLKAEVLSIAHEVRLKLFGSFFTTNGVEPFKADWANSHLRRLELTA